jgi:hypothetical protein
MTRRTMCYGISEATWSGISEAGLRWKKTGKKTASRRDTATCWRFGDSPSQIENLKLRS